MAQRDPIDPIFLNEGDTLPSSLSVTDYRSGVSIPLLDIARGGEYPSDGIPIAPRDTLFVLLRHSN